MSSSASEGRLLALPEPLRVVAIDDSLAPPSGLRIVLASQVDRAICPHCHTLSTARYERYRRHLADLPCAGQSVHLQVELWRYRCDCPTCPQRTFVERLSGWAPERARRTDRMREKLVAIGLANGGRAGARQAQALGLPVSMRTLLRLLHALPLPEAAVPRVLGVDDWAVRKGRRYGTLLYDLERHAPVDLLPDRQAQSLAEWLQAHPGVEVISRDRAEAYAAGAREGAPDATQVADRWHLLKNLTDHLDDWVEHERPTLERARLEAPEAGATPGSGAAGPARVEPAPDLPPPRTEERGRAEAIVGEPSPTEQRRQIKRERRKACYEQVQALRTAGVHLKQTAHQVGVSERTVVRFLEAESYPERKARSDRGQSRLGADRSYLQRRIAQGCANAAQLWRELKERGYTGSYASIYALVREIRGEKGEAGAAHPASVPEKLPALQRWKLIEGMIGERDALEEPDRQVLERLLERSEPFAKVYDLTQRFIELMRTRQSDPLGEWLEQAGASGIRELKSFVAGVKHDQAAVEAGIRLSWSNGPVEGFINRIKEIKRRMYGRAGFELLRRMVLWAP